MGSSPYSKFTTIVIGMLGTMPAVPSALAPISVPDYARCHFVPLFGSDWRRRNGRTID
jgi:hypothetical protein